MKWITVETHTHTLHSDARLTVAELIENARRAELDAFVLTDHNTDSGLDEVPAGQTAPAVIPGIEWTTFFGHVVIIAPERFVEWRDLTAENLDAHLDAVHAAGGVAVMAHPCDPGEPFCCGCHWDFLIPNWEKIDAMEVWHEFDPSLSRWNARAKALWERKLREGFRPTALSAADWHVTFPPETVFGVNYVLIDETLPLDRAVKEAIRAGRVYFTAGPTVELTVSVGDAAAGVGGAVPTGYGEAELRFDGSLRRGVWAPYELVPQEAVWICGGRETVLPFTGYGHTLRWQGQLEPGPARVELRGTAHGKPCTLLMTDPVWVEA